MTTVAQLTIEMAANVARLRQDMASAISTVDGAMSKIRTSADTAMKALGAIGVSLSVAGLSAWVKNAINAADEMSKIGQRAGVAVKDVAGLQLAFRQSGVSAEQFVPIMAKLGVAVANGNDALKAMGISSRNADGSLKSTRQVLGEVSNAFSGYEAGANKTALAVKLFGEEGAKIMPLLNGGAQALDDYDAMAKKLGLTLEEDVAQQAEKFNDTIDLMGEGMQGVGRQVAAELLPTLSGLAGQFFESMTSGDRLKNTAAFLAAVLKGLYVVALGVVEVFTTVGKTIGGVSAAIVAALTGDFSGAANILREMKNDLGTGWKTTLAEMTAAWAATGNASVEAMAATAKATAQATPAVQGAAKAVKTVVDEFARLRDKLTAKDSGVDADFIKNLQTLKTAYDGGRISLAEYLRLSDLYIATQPYMVEQTTALAAAVKSATEAGQAHVKQYQDAAATAGKRVTDLQQEADALAYAEKYQVGLAQAVELTTIARLKEQQVAAMGNEAIVLQLQKEIEAREQIVGMLDSKDAREAGAELRKNEAAEWAKTWDQIGQSFTDALMQGGKSVKQYLEGLFRTMVLRPLLAPITGAVTSMVGGPAAAGQGGGSLMGTLNSIGGVMNNLATSSANFLSGATINAQAAGMWTRAGDWMATSSSNTMANAGSWMQANPGVGSALGMAGNAFAGYGLQKGISNGYKVGNGKVVDAITLAASAYFGPIAGVAAGVFNRAFGRKLKDSGLMGDFGGDAGFAGSQYEFYKGGLFRSDKTKTSPIDAELRKALADQYKLLSDNTSGMAGQLKLSAAALETYTRKVKFSTKGLTEDQINQRLTEEFAAMGDEMAALVLGTTEFNRAGEGASAALVRLSSSITATNGMLGVLGLKLFEVGLSGADMASELADKFGGLDAMAQATTAYYTEFYGASERADAALLAMTNGVEQLGLTLPTSTTGFRALVSGLDLTTESGRTAYAELVKIAPEFAALQLELRRLADETAVRLIATFTARGQLVPVLADVSAALVGATNTAAGFAGPVSTINRLLGDASSGTLVFGEQISTATAALSPAQLAISGLQDEVLALRLAAGGAVVDVAGLSRALAEVDTMTFVATVTGVFTLIGQRIKDTLSQITDERVALRDAAIAIVGPGVMSAAQIRSGIQSSMVGLPTGAGVANAQNALAGADAMVAQREAAFTANASLQLQQKSLLDSANAARDQRQTLETLAGQITSLYYVPTFGQNFGYRGVAAPTSSSGQGAIDFAEAAAVAIQSFSNRARSDTEYAFLPYAAARANAGPDVMQRSLAGLSNDAAQALSNYNNAVSVGAVRQAELSAATTAQAAAVQAARTAQLDYVDALQKYSLDASRAVTGLGRLREETVKYFESQRQLAELMTGTASGLRATVAQFRFDQLDPAAQLANLQDRYNVAYSMALSTTGEALASYGNELNSLINPLLAKAQETGIGGAEYSNLVTTVLARAEATASRLEANAPMDYQAESLGLLGQIDSTLIALEKGAISADQLIVNAIDAGRDTTRDGLRAVVAAITGQAVPAFALGGYHTGGVRLVGENGPELEVTGPSRIYNARQTASMLGGGGEGAMVQELRALRAEVAAQRREMAALQTQIVVNTGKTARQMDRWDGEGLPVRNLDGEVFAVEGA